MANSPITLDGSLGVDAVGKTLHRPDGQQRRGDDAGRQDRLDHHRYQWSDAQRRLDRRPGLLRSADDRHTYDLLTAGSVGGAGTVTPVFIANTRVTGTTSVVGNALQLAITTGAADLVWNNASTDGLWNLNSSLNFNNGGSNDVFKNLDAVTFDDSLVPNGPQTVTLAGVLTPTVVTVNATNNAYTFAGSGWIARDGA